MATSEPEATEEPQAATLTLANPFFPGWEVLLDGSRLALRIEPGDPFTLPVPAGEHRVVLRYRPLSLRLGAGLFAIGFLLLVWGLARSSYGTTVDQAEVPFSKPSENR